jgi:hypothetical protein
MGEDGAELACQSQSRTRPKISRSRWSADATYVLRRSRISDSKSSRPGGFPAEGRGPSSPARSGCPSSGSRARLRLPVAGSGGGPSAKAGSAITSTAADMDNGGAASAGRRLERGRSFLLTDDGPNVTNGSSGRPNFYREREKHLSIPAGCKHDKIQSPPNGSAPATMRST